MQRPDRSAGRVRRSTLQPMLEPKTRRTSFPTLPHLLSLSRIALIPAIAGAILNGAGAVSIVLFCFVVASDVLDGLIARRRQQASKLGTMLDHGSDAAFVTATCALCAYLGLLPVLLAPLIALAFIQYLLDSHVLEGADLRPSGIGRLNGIAYFVIAGIAILVHHYVRVPVIISALQTLGWLLVATTLVSIVERGIHVLQARRML